MRSLIHPEWPFKTEAARSKAIEKLRTDFVVSSRRVETALDEDSCKAVLRSATMACLVIVYMWYCRIGHTLELPVAETREPYDAGKAARVAGILEDRGVSVRTALKSAGETPSTTSIERGIAWLSGREFCNLSGILSGRWLEEAGCSEAMVTVSEQLCRYADAAYVERMSASDFESLRALVHTVCIEQQRLELSISELLAQVQLTVAQSFQGGPEFKYAHQAQHRMFLRGAFDDRSTQPRLLRITKHGKESVSTKSTAKVIIDFRGWLEKVQKLTPHEYIDFAARSRRALAAYSASFTMRGQGTKVRITALPNDELRVLTKVFELGPELASSIDNELALRADAAKALEQLGVTIHHARKLMQLRLAEALEASGLQRQDPWLELEWTYNSSVPKNLHELDPTVRSILVRTQETISLSLGWFLRSKPIDKMGLRAIYVVWMRPTAHQALGMCGGGSVLEAACRAKCLGLHSLVKGGGAGLNENKLYKFWFRYSAAPSLRAFVAKW
jgi:hypothetical protein